MYEHVERDAHEVLRTLVPIETEVVTRDGHWLTVRMRPYRTVDDRIEGVVLTFSDITARKQAEEALSDELDALNRLQRLSTGQTDPMRVDAPLAHLLDAAMELVGADCGAIQIVDKTTSTLHIGTQRGLSREFLKHFQAVTADDGSPGGRALASGKPVLIEDVEHDPKFTPHLTVTRAAGLRTVMAAPMLAPGGRIVGMLSLYFRDPRALSEHDRRMIDICARQGADAINSYILQMSLRTSESRWRRVLETDAVGVMFFDDAGILLDANNAFLEMTGYSREQLDARALDWRKMTPPEWIEVSEQQMAMFRETGRVGPYEKEYLRVDGARRWMLFAGRRIEPNVIAEYCIDISDRKRAEQERELLSHELSHRVKNTLAVVQALAHQTRGATIDEYIAAFTGRLAALAKAHDLLLGSDWRDANLKVLVSEALSAYRVKNVARVRIDGAPLTVNPRQALGLGLLLHELGTNALKYGSLSVPDGTVAISWTSDPQQIGARIRLTWAESGGPDVRPPDHVGFGSRLIARVCEQELEGEVQTTFAKTGLICEIIFPIHRSG